MRTEYISEIMKRQVLIIWVLLILSFGRMGTTSELIQSQTNSSIYPPTPEAVVEAFVNAALTDSAITDDRMRICSEMLHVQYKYLPTFDDAKVLSETHITDPGEPWGPLLDRFHIAQGFQIKEIAKSQDRATVTVVYKRLGWISVYPLAFEKCRALNGKNKNGQCRFLHITNDLQEAKYELARLAGFWKIINSYEPYISKDSAIKLLRCLIRIEPDVVKTYPSDKQKIEILQDLHSLNGSE
jgi:hypothetical protein